MCLLFHSHPFGLIRINQVVYCVYEFRSGSVHSPGRFPEGAEECSDDEVGTLVTSFFEDDGKSVEASPTDFPSPLPGGVVLDQRYGVSAKSLSALILKPSSAFVQEFLTVQKTTEYAAEPWRNARNDNIQRVVTYMKAATKMIKSVKATETQTCRRLDDRGFVVDVSCATPDVPYGSNFLVELQVILPFNHAGSLQKKL